MCTLFAIINSHFRLYNFFLNYSYYITYLAQTHILSFPWMFVCFIGYKCIVFAFQKRIVIAIPCGHYKKTSNKLTIKQWYFKNLCVTLFWIEEESSWTLRLIGSLWSCNILRRNFYFWNSSTNTFINKWIDR